MKQSEIRDKFREHADQLYDLILDIEEQDLEGIIDSIRNAKRVRSINFSCCGVTKLFPAEEVYAPCPKCETETKMRCFDSIATVYDVLWRARSYFDDQKKELKGDFFKPLSRRECLGRCQYLPKSITLNWRTKRLAS